MLGEFFDPSSELFIHEHCRPHWSQAGAIVFVTFRTNDSIPKEVLRRWEREKRNWLFREHLNPNGKHWSQVINELADEDRIRFHRRFDRCREEFLDTCHGKCLLRRKDLRTIVEDSLLHFDGDRYRMGDFIVMPNHVHLLAAFPSEDAMSKQCDSWLHYAAHKINAAMGQKGKFWQQEPFDHLVRNLNQFEYLRKYIAENPSKADLKAGEYTYYQSS